jgi:hypothetical protein
MPWAPEPPALQHEVAGQRLDADCAGSRQNQMLSARIGRRLFEEGDQPADAWPFDAGATISARRASHRRAGIAGLRSTQSGASFG